MRILRKVKRRSMITAVKLHGEGATKYRTMDMDITKGMEVYIRKVVPLGDSVEVNVKGYELPLRKADAKMTEVQQELLFSKRLSQL